MRKVFYVKKNPAMPMSNDNWIEMNSFCYVLSGPFREVDGGY